MKKLRQIHLYLGVLFAPSILFFALTGAYQTFRWNENGTLGALTPIAQKMASIHKNAALEKVREPENEAVSAEKRPKETRATTKPETEKAPRRDRALPLKIYIFLMALGLITSTATGVTLAFKFNRSRRLIWGLLIAGTVLPLLLLRI